MRFPRSLKGDYAVGPLDKKGSFSLRQIGQENLSCIGTFKGRLIMLVPLNNISIARQPAGGPFEDE